MTKLAIALKQYLSLAIVYLALVFLLPANKIAVRDYHLTSLSYHLLLFVIILPLIGIWFGAFYSYARLQQYTDAIQDTAEAKDFGRLASGFKLLAWGSALTAIFSICVNSLANNYSQLHAAAIIATNYAGLLVPLISFTIIGGAARGLNARVNTAVSDAGTKALMVFFMIIGVIYCFFTFRLLDMHSLSSSLNPYYLPVWLIIISIVIPFLYTWFIGLMAAYEIHVYGGNSSGVLYQRAVRQLSFGVIAVIASSIVVQYLRSVVPRTGHLSLNAVLLIVNISYIFMAVGYIYLSLGSRQLRKIEEV